jgi:hypothetical protein
MGFELEEPRPHIYRRHFGRVARILAIIGYAVSLLSMTSFGLTLSLGIIAIIDFSIDYFLISLISIIVIPIVKVMICVVLGLVGMNLLSIPRYRKWSVVLLIVAGIVFLIPVGEPISTSIIIQNFGWWPFLPYWIGGALFIAAGIFAALWTPEMRLPRPAHFKIPATDIRPPKTKELYVCPNCRTPLLGDERFCPGCGKVLRRG